MDKFLSERQYRQQKESDGCFELGSEVIMPDARERHIDQGRMNTNKKRLTHLAKAKCRQHLAGKPLGLAHF